ncbi:putative saga complex component [Phaeomoniella chlamydospora]|uniref:Putative saga complex component n=1 Tax=Phaeomoniella chlamydospora TaxID=158046 RepID=A0A0G2EM99_PHACM|nr:putative saga complex component [Phaeomoniella chlamydospora]
MAYKFNIETVADISQLDDLYRKNLKAAEEESEIYQRNELVTKVELLKALRSSEESQARNAPTASSKARNIKRTTTMATSIDLEPTESPASPSETVISDKLKRVKSGPGQRSASVGSQMARSTMDGISVKIEEGADGLNRGTNAEKAGQLVVGAEVMFKHNKKQNGQQEGEGIQCVIKHTSGDGQKKRITYDVQDIDEDQVERKTYKTTAAYLIPIPLAGAPTPTFGIGKQVLARYPDTTTFYRAEVMSIQKDTYRLKFEGEEDDKEMEVDRRLVLDIGGK